MRPPAGGILPTVLTPLDDDDHLDEPALRAQLAYFERCGVDGLVVLGSIGEASLAPDDLRRRVVEVAASSTLPVLVGITEAGTKRAAMQVEEAARLGACAALVALPAYYALSFASVKAHYAALADVMPTFFYNYPAATHLALADEEVAELVAMDGMAGAKESVFDVDAVEAHVRGVGDLERTFFSGSELSYLALREVGVSGAVSPGAVFMPRTAVAMHRAAESGDADAAKAAAKGLFETLPLVADLEAKVSVVWWSMQAALRKRQVIETKADTTIARMKAGLARRGVPMGSRVLPPLPQLSDRDREAVDAAMTQVLAIEPES
ncbi:MAG: dihydrodipicolinate synthase family protein [Deltaproteobacteria bacterium]